MPHPIPHLHEILALEAQVHADKYDVSPAAACIYPDMQMAAIALEAKLHSGILYIKKS